MEQGWKIKGWNINPNGPRTVSNVKTLDQMDFAGGKRSLVFGEATGSQSPSGQE